MAVTKDCRGSFFIEEGKKGFGLEKRMTLHLDFCEGSADDGANKREWTDAQSINGQKGIIH